MSRDRVIVIGAGAGGLSCAISLAAHGHEVIVLEAADVAGGKIRTVRAGDLAVDAGPTVLTMRWVFDELFAEAGERLDDHLRLTPLAILARHAWSERECFDLHADRETATDAVGRFAGATQARGYRAFCDHARDIHETLLHSFMTAERPTPTELVRRAGFARMMRAGPFADMWTVLGRFFTDARLRQLFGRYATYCGSSPFEAPATLMLVAHVEQEGVWTVGGGMARLAQVLGDVAVAKGAVLRLSTRVRDIVVTNGRVGGVRTSDGELIEGGRVVLNGDASALALGLFGGDIARRSGIDAMRTRSLSAVTFALKATASGFPLLHHNVFFSRDYAREFRELFRGRQLPTEPTVYVCAQDRGDRDVPAGEAAPERIFALVNAPAIGDTHSFDDAEIAACARRMNELLARCGLTLTHAAPAAITTPTTFNTLFPGTGGALYGPATHGAMATFSRPASRTKLPGLYLAGGSVHPGPGVPMAALSGRIAARSILADLASTRRFHAAAMPGGMSTR